MESKAIDGRSDLYVDAVSSCLLNCRIDFVVTGGIACIDSPKWIRQLRRYGADVRVFMTKSAESFVSAKVFEWASAQPVHIELSGSAEHISSADAVVVAPCTLDFMGRLSLGLADSAASAVCHSKMGRAPVILSPSMHSSLMESPAFGSHFANLSAVEKLHFLEPKLEERKAKAPHYEDACDQIAHIINKSKHDRKNALVLLGRSRSYLDDVRYVSNYSSGALGVALSKELFRNGHDLKLIQARTDVQVPAYLPSLRVETVDDFAQALEAEDLKSFDIAYFAAALLDFEFKAREAGKKSSKDKRWDLSLQASRKIVQGYGAQFKRLVAFKLESNISEQELESRVADWATNVPCHFVLGNLLSSVSDKKHRAFLYDKEKAAGLWIEGKSETASQLAELCLKTSIPTPLQSPLNQRPQQFV